MTNLSPTAQAVLDAYRDKSWTPDEEDNGRYYKFSHKAGIAASLRAAADFLVYETQVDDPMMTTVRVVDVADLIIIANELEQQL